MGAPSTIFNYELKEELGRGGFGIVRRAVHKDSGRVAAVKLLPEGLANDETFVRRFRQEIKILGNLKHPNIVDFVNADVENGTPYLMMELCEGKSLEDRLKGRSPSVEEAVGISRQFLDALAYAHKQRVVHGDIHPGNILFDSKGNVKIGDFGLANLVGDLFKKGSYSYSGFSKIGRYVAPEKRDGIVCPQNDIYSFGLVLAEMLGRVPGTNRPMKEINRDVPEDLAAIIEKTQYEYAHRYKDAQAMLEALIRPQKNKTVRHADTPKTIDTVLSKLHIPRYDRQEVITILEEEWESHMRTSRLANFAALVLIGGLAALIYLTVPNLTNELTKDAFYQFFQLRTSFQSASLEPSKEDTAKIDDYKTRFDDAKAEFERKNYKAAETQVKGLEDSIKKERNPAFNTLLSEVMSYHASVVSPRMDKITREVYASAWLSFGLNVGDIYIKDKKGDRLLVRESTFTNMRFRYPKLSPDGEHVVFEGTQAVQGVITSIFVVDTQGDNLKRLTEGVRGGVRYIDERPYWINEKTIGFDRTTRSTEYEFRDQIASYQINIDGTGLRERK